MSRQPRRPQPRPYQQRRRRDDYDDEEEEQGSGFDLIASPRTPRKSPRTPRTPQTPRAMRRQGSIFGAPLQMARKSFDSQSDEESEASFRPPRRRPRDESPERMPRMRRGFERMSRFFGPGHFAPQPPPGGWPGDSSRQMGQSEKDPVQEQVDGAVMRLSLYQSMSVLGSGLGGMFLIVGFVLNAIVVLQLPGYTSSDGDGASTPGSKVIIKAHGENAIPGSTLAGMQPGFWASALGFLPLAAGIFALLGTILQMFGKRIRKNAFEGLKNFCSGFSDLEDQPQSQASESWGMYGQLSIKLWYPIIFALPVLGTVVAFLLAFFDQRGTVKSSLSGAGSVSLGNSSIFVMVAAGLLVVNFVLNMLRQHLLVWLLQFRQSNGLIAERSPPPAYFQQAALPHPAETPAYQPGSAYSRGHQRNPSAFFNPSAFSKGSYQGRSAFTKASYPTGSQFTLQRNPSAFTAASYPKGSEFTLQSMQSKRSQRSAKSQPWGPSQSESVF